MEKEILKLAHISDTHFCASYQGNMMEAAFAKGSDPKEKIQALLKKALQEKADCLIISGDIVHEGVEADYRGFRQIVEETLQGAMKVIYVCGNHDRKEALKKGLGLECEGPGICYVDYVKDYRIVVLDSAVEGKEGGAVGEAQEQWLQEVLSEPYGSGTLLTFHHPVAWDVPQFVMPVSDNLKKILANSDVVGMFCGHTHSNNVQSWNGIGQYTADSSSFGMEVEQDMILFVEKCGMNFYQIQGGHVSTHVEPLHGKLTVMAEIPLQEMMKYIQ